MKLLTRFLLVGTIAATAYFFIQKDRQLVGQAGPGLQTHFANVVPAASPASGASAPVFRVVRVQKPLDPLTDLKILLRQKLRQWQESQVQDPDNEESRDSLLREMLARVTDENVAEIVQSLSSEEMDTPFGAGALRHWMQIDPTSATNWLASHPQATQEQILTVADGWITRGDDLKQYIDQLPDTSWKQSFLQAASSELSLQDPREAITLAQKLAPGSAQTNLLRSVVCSWVSIDANAALDWVAHVKDPVLREQVIASAVQSYALTDPVQAATWLVSEVKSADITKDATLNILNTWVVTDPNGAANWVSRFPESDLKAAAMTTVLDHWQQTDPIAAVSWIKNMSHDK